MEKEVIIKYAAELNKNNSPYDFNTREFEDEINKVVVNLDLKSLDKVNDIEIIKECIKKDLNLGFVAFFIIFTAFRKANYSNLVSLCDEFIYDFNSFHIFAFLRLLALYNSSKDSDTLLYLIKRTKKLLNNPEKNLNNHAGILNFYCELICCYYEKNLDLRNDNNNLNVLKEGLQAIDKAIGKYNDHVYEKFYLNKGRLLVLLGKYDDGENLINKAILELPMNSDRFNKVHSYEQYLVTASFVRAFDSNAEKYKDLEKTKVSNYKSIALMTTLLGFLLGTINIFVTVDDPLMLGKLMLSFVSLLIFLCGLLLTGLTFTFKEKQIKLYVFDISLIVLGVCVFIISTLWIMEII